MDEIIETCGEFGRFQKLLLVIMGSVTGLCGFTQFMSVFNTASPDLMCKQKNEDNYYLPTNTCDIFMNISQSVGQNSPYECSFSKEYYGKTIVNEWNLVCDRIPMANLTQTFYQIGSLSCFFVCL